MGLILPTMTVKFIDNLTGERDACANCGESFNTKESDATDTEEFCGSECENEFTEGI